MKNNVSKILIGIALHFTLLNVTVTPVFAADINFSGHLSIVEDNGGAVYSGVPIGSEFFGAINDVTFSGFISDGTTVTEFSCCIEASGLELVNDDILDADGAMFINSLAGTNFVAGDLIDTINLDGDGVTAGGGRIEIGIVFVLDPLAFNDESPDNYPPNPDDVLVTLFDIEEDDDQGVEFYTALGVVDSDMINFHGQLDTVRVDNGGAVYSGVQIGTEFFIEFDLVTGLSSTSDGTTVTPFIAFFKDGSFFLVINDFVLDADDAAEINSLTGTNFVAGDLIDIIELEGDALTAGGGIIEIGVAFFLDSLAFDDESPDNYPPNPDDVLIALFDIEEDDDQGVEIYAGGGVVESDFSTEKKTPIAIFIILGQDEE